MRLAPTVSHFAFLPNQTRQPSKRVRPAGWLPVTIVVGAVVASASSASFRALLLGRLFAVAPFPASQPLVAKNRAAPSALAAPALDTQLKEARRGHTATLL